MRSHWRKLAVAIALCGSAAYAQDVTPASGIRRGSPPPVDCLPAPLTVGPDGQPLPAVPPATNPANPNPAAPANTDAFAQAGEGGTAAASAFAPAFFGDLIGISSARFAPGVSNSLQGRIIRTPSAAKSGGWGISDGESPVPTDRVYYDFNWYSDVNRAANGNIGGQAFGVFRNVIGLEKTFFNERASIGLRLPFVDVESPISQLAEREFADMSIILKWAFVREPDRVLSGGMVLTVPTGQGLTIEVPTPEGVINGRQTQVIQDVIIQPYVGYVRNLNKWLYFQVFNSIAIPTDSRDVVMLTNSGALGFYLYRNPNDRFVQSIIPTVELHDNTPLTDRGARTLPIGASDQLNITTGVYIRFPTGMLGFAVGTPLLGPRPYDVEVTANYTIRF